MGKHLGVKCFERWACLCVLKTERKCFLPHLGFPCCCLTWRNTTLNSTQPITFSTGAVVRTGEPALWEPNPQTDSLTRVQGRQASGGRRPLSSRRRVGRRVGRRMGLEVAVRTSKLYFKIQSIFKIQYFLKQSF